jgi:hypothetical protein
VSVSDLPMIEAADDAAAASAAGPAPAPAVPRSSGALLPQPRLAGPMPWVLAILIALVLIAAAGGLALRNLASAARADLAAARAPAKSPRSSPKRRWCNRCAWCPRPSLPRCSNLGWALALRRTRCRSRR